MWLQNILWCAKNKRRKVSGSGITQQWRRNTAHPYNSTKIWQRHNSTYALSRFTRRSKMKGIRKIAPYIPGEQPKFPDMIKINTNENAFAPSPKVQDALDSFRANDLRLYPSITNDSLRVTLANTYGLDKENFIVGNGSDEILAFCFMAFFNSEYPVLFPNITYGFYKVWANLFGILFEEIPIHDDFFIHLDDYPQKNGGIVLANPNATVGTYIAPSEMKDFLSTQKDSIVLVDEAYVQFGGESLLPFVREFDNLVVIRTLSKDTALAGLRVGYAAANPDLIRIVQTIKNSFNPYSVDAISEKLAVAALKDQEYMHEKAAKICDVRETFCKNLSELGFITVQSKANFVLTTHPNYSMTLLFDELAKEHIFVRRFDTPPILSNFLRITIGTSEEMDRVVEAIRRLMIGAPYGIG
jgi:histidinol-phosphate aminotransferase